MKNVFIRALLIAALLLVSSVPAQPPEPVPLQVDTPPEGVTAQGDTARELSDWAERLLFNPAERTDTGVKKAADDVDEAFLSFETALRLEEENPIAQYNAGTVRLAVGLDDPGLVGATELLEAAARTGPPDLVPRAHYNLGSYRYETGDFRGAVEAYKTALRIDPDYADAKHNLELALRRCAEEEQQDDEQQDEQEEEQQEQQQEEQQQQQPPPPPQEEQEEQEEEQQEGSMSKFEDLPDMTAEEAAAILEAVENMERERRRKEAQEASKKTVAGKKDW